MLDQSHYLSAMLGWRMGKMVSPMIGFGREPDYGNNPGLYEAGTTSLKVPWVDLLRDGVVTVSDAGVVSSNNAGAVLAGDLVLPDDDTVLTIGDKAFRNCSELTAVVLPKSVQIINGYTLFSSYGAFSGCTKLAKVTFTGDSLTEIGPMVFGNCTSLTNIKLPASVVKIGASAFKNCSALTSIKLPESITTIYSNTFNGCSALTSIELPNSITEIQSGAFRYCSALTNIELPEPITTIKEYTFEGCSNIREIVIPPNVTNIMYWAFKDCSNLEKITFPNGFKTFGTFNGGSIIEGCEKLISITFPSTMTSIPPISFERSYVKEINVEDGCESYYSIDGVVYEIPASTFPLRLAVYPPGKTDSEVVIPEGVGDMAAWTISDNPYVTKITFPSTFRVAYDECLQRLSALETIEFLSDTPPDCYDTSFVDCPALTKIIVPSGCADTYKTVAAFTAYADIIVEASQ